MVCEDFWKATKKTEKEEQKGKQRLNLSKHNFLENFSCLYLLYIIA